MMSSAASVAGGPATDHTLTAPSEQATVFRAFDHPAVQAQITEAREDGYRDCALMVGNIRCAGCAAKVEALLNQMRGVRRQSLNFTTHRATLSYDPAVTRLSDVLGQLAAAGYEAHPYDPGTTERKWRDESKARIRQLGVAAICSAQLMAISLALYTGQSWGISEPVQELLRFTAGLLCVPVIGYAALPFMRGAVADLRTGAPGMDVPVALGMAVAFFGSVAALAGGEGDIYFDSVAMFTLFLLSARYVEFSLRRRNAAALERLGAGLPVMARRQGAKPTPEGEQLVPAASLAVGDRIEIRAGETVPADGIVESGTAFADESLLTGEHAPVPKSTGDPLLAGCCLEDGPVVMRVERAGDACVAGQIRRLVEQSLAAKPRISRTTMWIARYFISFVLLLAAGTAIWCLAYSPERAMETVVAVLVVTCPCALSLATPSTVTACVLALARRHILVADTNALDVLPGIRAFVFDKTGTLTVGEPTVTSLEVLSKLPEPQIREVAGALARSSTHPVGNAIARACPTPAVAETVRTTTGGGVEATIDGRDYALGNLRFVSQFVRAARTIADPTDPQTNTVSYLADQSGLLGRFVVEDATRPDAGPTVATLRRDGYRVSLLSGDREGPVRALADELDVECFDFGLDPWGKRVAIRARRRGHGPVAMVGDGINDAPVLAAADVSVAMGTSPAISLQSASIVLLKNNLGALLTLLGAAKRCARIIHQNLAFAVVYNVVAIPAAVAGWLPPWAAAAGMSASSLLVVLNSTRARTLDDTNDDIVEGREPQ